MRKVLTAVIVVVAFAFPMVAKADKCYVDSDCGTGYVCSQAGACVAPSSSSSGGGGGEPNYAMLLLGCVIVGAVGWYILQQSMAATKAYGGLVPNQTPAHQPKMLSIGFHF